MKKNGLRGRWPTLESHPMSPPRRTASSLLVPLALALSANAGAQTTEAPNRLDNVVITATRSAQPLDSTYAQATIITRADIDTAGVATLTELLQRKAGLEIRATGGPGQPSSVFIRGASGTHTLVLIDGLRVGSSTSGATAFENIPLGLIERVEIVKGPMSSLYGSDAIGGVIQIFTRAAGNARATASVGAGSDSTGAFNAGFSVAEGKTALSFDVGHRRSTPQSATNPAAGPFTYNADRDPYKNTHALVRLSQTLWQGETLGFTAWQSRGNTDFDAGPTVPASNRQTLSGYHITSENNFTADWKSRLILGRTIDDSAISSSFPGRFKTGQSQASWFNEFKTANGHMTAGIEWRGEKLDSDTGYTAKKRDTTSIFGGYLEKLGPAQLEFTLRRDEEEQFGRRNTGVASYGYAWSSMLSGYLRGGRAFRAPSFNDLYYPGFSNPALKPERSDQAEAGMRLRTHDARVNVAYFENRIDDLIVFVFDPVRNKGQPENVNRARIRGWEAQVDAIIFGTTLKASFTAQRPVDRDTGYQLRSRAKRFGALSGARNFGAWDVSADLAASGARYDSNRETPATRMGGYGVLAANIRYRIDKNVSVEVIGQNLTARKYQLAQGYNTPSRSVFLNVRLVGF